MTREETAEMEERGKGAKRKETEKTVGGKKRGRRERWQDRVGQYG